MGKERNQQQQEIKERYSLREIKDTRYDENTDIIYLKQLTHKTVSDYDLINNTIGRNVFAQQVRQLKSILVNRLDRSDRQYFNLWNQQYQEAIDANDSLRMMFQAEDTLNEVLSDSKQRSYEAWEDDNGGILSEYIKGELAIGRGFSMLIKAPPRSGKSYCGLRLCSNVSGDNFEIGSPDESKDIVYTDNMFHTRRTFRREHNILAFSSMMVDEGIEVMDSMKGIWDESIQSMIKTLKTGFFENWLLVVVTPDESDIAKRVRQSFHAIMEPYYDNTELTMGEIKRNLNWNTKTGFSTWKFHSNDERIKVHGLGRISKINIKIPPKAITEPYEILSQYYKTKIQNREAAKAGFREYKHNPQDFVNAKVDELLNDQVKLESTYGEHSLPTIDNVSNVLGIKFTAARRVTSRLKMRLREGNKNAEANKVGTDTSG